jgi:hypothetical protein
MGVTVRWVLLARSNLVTGVAEARRPKDKLRSRVQKDAGALEFSRA